MTSHSSLSFSFAEKVVLITGGSTGIGVAAGSAALPAPDTCRGQAS